MSIEKHPYYNFYYQNNSKITSKTLALYNAHTSFSDIKKDNITWRLHNFEKALESSDLYQEPIEDLETLYTQRAIQLRNDYDYLILNYSGGPDSHNILETFMMNGIFLDEIFIYSYFDEQTINKLANEDTDTFSLFPEFYEAEKSAYPIAKHMVDTYSPHTKITFINNFASIHRDFWLNRTENDFINDIYGNASILLTHRNVVRSRNPNFVKEWKYIKEQKKTAHIWGIEKPRVNKDKDGLYFTLLDHTILSRVDMQYFLTENNIPNNHELFYIHPAHIKMFLKLAYSVSNINLPNTASTRKNENILAKAIYKPKVKIPYLGLKVSDITALYDTIPILKEMSNTGLLPGYYDMVDPFLMKLHFDYSNSEASMTYEKFTNFIFNSLFKNLMTKKSMMHILASGFPTRKYYFKKT